MENSKWLGRQARPGIKHGTFLPLAFSAGPQKIYKEFHYQIILITKNCTFKHVAG